MLKERKWDRLNISNFPFKNLFSLSSINNSWNLWCSLGVLIPDGIYVSLFKGAKPGYKGLVFCLYRVSPHSPVRLILKTLHQSDVKSPYFKEGIFIVHRVKVVWPLVWTYPRRLQLPEQFEWRDNVLVVFLPVSSVKLLCSWTRCLVPKTSTLNQLVRLKK